MPPCTRGGKWAGVMPNPKEGSVGPGQAERPKKPQNLTGIWPLGPQTWKAVVGGWALKHWERTFSTWPHSPPVPVRERLQGDPWLASYAPFGTHPDDLGLHGHGLNVWEPHYPSPGCGGERVTVQNIGPYLGHPFGHALTLPIPQVGRISFPRAWGSVQPHLLEGTKAHGVWGPVFHPSLLNFWANLTIAGWRVIMSHKPSRY